MTGRIVVRLLQIPGRTSPVDGQYLVEYDPTRAGAMPDGTPLTAHLVCSPDPGEALQFAAATDAYQYVRRDSGVPRPDGRPDRPLTAFSLILEPVDA